MSRLNITRSNRLEVLALLLAEQLRVRHPSPMQPIEVVVGSRGMERYLRHALAEQLGICAQMEFPFPTAALDRLAGPRATRADPWAPDTLCWALLEVMPAVAQSEHGGPLRRYLEGAEDGDVVGSRAWGLARRIADVFDRYISYRPELVEQWSAGGWEAPPDQRWQVALWRAVRDHLGRPAHRAERLASLVDLAPHPSGAPLHIFGLSSMAPSWLGALGLVARSRPVELYLLCPSDQYWADLGRRLVERPALASAPREEVADQLRSDGERFGDAGHPLLLSWGRTGRDLQILLESLPDGFEDQRQDLFIDPLSGGDSVLHWLQADIVAAGHPSLQPDYAERQLDPADRSVQLHSCHGLTRQVEELRTTLLELLDGDPSLSPRDIVVMTPDIDAAAPLIGAVFDSGQRFAGREGWLPMGSPRLPWELADLAVRRMNPVADALLRVLEMVEGRSAASEVLDLLALEPVAERFGISAEERATVRGWVVDSGVRWAVDEADRERHEQPPDPQNTWRFGLDRLLMGVLMADDGRMPGGVRPFDTVEGAGTGLLGRLAEFCAVLFAQIDGLRHPRTLGQWGEQLGRCVDALTQTSGLAAWLTRRVREEIGAIEVEAELTHGERVIAVDALRAALSRRFEVASTAHQGSGGAITFCGMVPERAVPYRVVCLLGMDEGSFPRIGGRAAFDLLGLSPRIGDRDLRDEDRYLLLEAVLSARDHLLVFYTGRDVRTNESRPPAVPVSELCDALDVTLPSQTSVPLHQQLTRSHTLQRFGPENFASRGERWSYDARLVAGVQASLGKRRPKSPFLSMDLRVESATDPVGTVSVEQLRRFWSHPLRAFLQRSLRLVLARDGGADVPDREPLELGWLDHSQLLEALHQASVQGRDPEEERRRLLAAGQLPLGRAGEIGFDSMAELLGNMEAVAADLCGWSPQEAHPVDVELRREGALLDGRVEGMAPRGLVRFCYGQERPSELLDAAIGLAACRAMDPKTPSRALLVFGKLDGKGRPEIGSVGLEWTAADHWLESLLALRAQGLESPLPYFPRSSHALAKELLKRLPKGVVGADRYDPAHHEEEGVEAGMTKAQQAWMGGFSKGEREDRYNRHALGQSDPLISAAGADDSGLVGTALKVWGPVLDARRTARALKSWGQG